RSLKNVNVKLTIIDKTNHHLFQPLLYQVATSALAPRDIAYPIREILKKQKNVIVIMDEATEVLTSEKTVLFKSDRRLEYDYLIVAVGSKQSYFGNKDWEKFAPGLKTLNDAVKINHQLLKAYEMAEATDSRSQADRLLTFVVIGGGPTGVELAGTMAEIAQKTMTRNFRLIDPSRTRVLLIEAAPRILTAYPESLSKKAEEDLKSLGVTVLTSTKVTDIDEFGVQIGSKKIFTNNIVWAAGNDCPAMLKTLGVPQDRESRVIVNPDLSIPGHPEVFIIGDSAHIKDQNGNLIPGIAPAAIQQGKYVGQLIKKGVPPHNRKPFRYHDKGLMATIGKARAIAIIGKFEFSGFLAWCLWSFVHVAFLVGFRTRSFVMLEWMFWYITERRSSRLIYESDRRDVDSNLNHSRQ
ncbi:MAG: NAD(P)/FAD-dependent oxidoreductase, partial [Chlamydiota bacterium]